MKVDSDSSKNLFETKKGRLKELDGLSALGLDEHGMLQADQEVSVHDAAREKQKQATNTTIRTELEIKQELNEMGVNLMEPESRKEEIMASALDAFSSFILEEEQEKCQAILDKHMYNGTSSSVGELQGGSDQHSIYRVLITDDEDDREAATELLKEFYLSWQGKRYSKVLTIEKLKQYMLGMCEKHSNTCEYTDHCSSRKKKYAKLGNLMFVLSFGPINGQVRHIDNMVTNLQICLYMSSDCPSTIIYTMDGLPITNVNELVESWEKNENHINPLPDLVKSILQDKGDTRLKSKWYTKYFSFWDTVNINLKCFGKLYQPVSLQLSLKADPGTTLVAGGNEVHAGPPTNGPRMFAFAIGIPEEDDEREEDENEDNNGEVQFSPVLLHVDLCCILFSIIDFEYSNRKDEHQEAKRFLLNVLLTLVKDNPRKEIYSIQMGVDRIEVRDWLGHIIDELGDQKKENILVQEALESDTMFYSPDVKKRRAKKKKRRIAK